MEPFSQPLGLDLDLNASRELQAHQSLHRLIGRSQDINQSLVGAHLKLLAAVLIFVDGTQNGDDLLLCRQRHRPGNSGARALRCLNDLLGGGIHQLVIVPLESDPDFFFDCHEQRLLKIVGGRRFYFRQPIRVFPRPAFKNRTGLLRV